MAHNYRKAPYFNEIKDLLEPLFRERKYIHLTDLNFTMLQAICKYLGIETKISGSWEYNSSEGKTERLLDLCLQASANTYISGPAAKDYLDEAIFAKSNVAVEWFDYSGYPEYPQLHGEFTHNVSIVDLLFNCGSMSSQFMKFNKGK